MKNRIRQQTQLSAETFSSTAKFTDVWLLESSEWKLTKPLGFEYRTK